MRTQAFTLIELMIVVAIIAIITAIAIPSLTNARKAANEARAISTLRTLSTVQEQYKTRFGGYASSPDDLQDTGYVDIIFDEYALLSYTFSRHTWSLSAGPTTPSDGDRFFFVDQSGVIRFSGSGPATSSSQPVD